MMTHPICETCGTQFDRDNSALPRCPICDDDRQYVGWQGQRWTSHGELAKKHRARIEEEHGLLGFGVTPGFAIDQRALLLQTNAGNILWECTPLVTTEAVDALRARGGVDRIIISHPHFYSAMAEWSEALGGVPIVTHAADSKWIQRRHAAHELWSGEELRLSDEVTLIRCGGHFEGSTALHWAAGPAVGGSLFSGDALQVGLDRRHVSFMYSYPNLIPMKIRDVLAMRSRLARFSFDNVHGYTWGRDIIGNGRQAVDASFDRYLKAVSLPEAS